LPGLTFTTRTPILGLTGKENRLGRRENMTEELSWRQGVDLWPPLGPTFELEAKKTALLIIDMQHCDAHRNYGLGKILAAKWPQLAEYYFTRLENIVVPNHVKLLEFFRKNDLRIIFVTLGSEVPDLSDLVGYRRAREKRMDGRIMFYKGEFEYSILPELNRQENEIIIHKTTGGAFNSSPIDKISRAMGIDGFVITGVVTNACVETTARDAADRGYPCILVENACASLDQASHDATLRCFARISGHVMTTDEVIAYFGEKL